MKHVGFLQYIAKLKGHIFQLWERIKKEVRGTSEMRELRQRTIEKQSPNPVKEHIIQTDENRKRLYRRLAVFSCLCFYNYCEY